jgi:FAD-linked oxidoreductase
VDGASNRSGTWRNWAGNQSAPCSVVRPRGTAAIVEAIAGAARENRRVKPIGSGHSSSGIGRPVDGGVQIDLSRHAELISLDSSSGLVTVQAGMRLHRLDRVLADAGLALTNLGDIDRQTVSGALSTGTHGTGARFGGLATQVRGLELVLAGGEVLRCSPIDHPDVFGPARIGLGALGVVSSVTLQTERAFPVRAEETSMPLAEVMERFDELADGTDHFEFYWFPHTDRTLVKRNTRLAPGAGLDPLSARRAWWDDEFLANRVFGWTVAAGRWVPPLVRPINRLSARALGSRTFTDRSDRVFVSARRVRFLEMEYAVPRAAAVEMVGRVRRMIEESGFRVGFPIEVRVAAADDIALSPANGRASAYVAVHSPVGVEHRPYFDAVEEIAGDYAGRPHWGKLHGLDARRLRERYPAFEQFVELRDRLDPEHRFGNPYLDRVLGRVLGTARETT